MARLGSVVFRRLSVAAALLVVTSAPVALARQGAPSGSPFDFLHKVAATRIADPKLDQSSIEVSYLLDPASSRYDVRIDVLSRAAGSLVTTIYYGKEFGQAAPRTRTWDGRDAAGKFVDPGAYTLRVEARDARAITRRIDYDLDLVRLGIREIAAQSSSPSGVNEWQVVYFMKDKKYAYYATPASGEYLCRADAGDVSDLDFNDGSPRPAPPVHAKTDEPLLETTGAGNRIYENDYHNYPLCYLAGADPKFDVTFGVSCALADGTRGACNYPVAGYEIRCIANDDTGRWTASPSNIAPGATATMVGPTLPATATRTERNVRWRFQYRVTGGLTWIAIPGSYSTTHRIYTLLDHPYWATGASGTQYSGPWVEVLDYLYTWSTALGVTCNTNDDVVEAFVKGYFGQQGSLTTAIEDVHYDCPSEGGDGGATHYFDWGGWISNLSRLLNAHASGKFVNCTDCASSTTVMLSMLGVPGFQMDHLGSMQLRAIWGVGCDDYTLDLWNNGGGGGHGFSYHHITTRDGGTNISDACLCVDEDGNADKLPGTPGFNHDRDWNNYESLVAKGNVSWYTENLPRIQ